MSKSLLSILSRAGCVLVGLSTIANEANSSFIPLSASEIFFKYSITDFDKIQKEIDRPRVYTREGILLSYEEWKAYEKASKDPRTDGEIKQFIKADKQRRYKVLQILASPDNAFNLLTKEEKEMYKSEFKLFDPEFDVPVFNQKYNTKFSIEEFQNNLGAKILWFFDQHHSYRYTEEKVRNKEQTK